MIRRPLEPRARVVLALALSLTLPAYACTDEGGAPPTGEPDDGQGGAAGDGGGGTGAPGAPGAVDGGGTGDTDGGGAGGTGGGEVRLPRFAAVGYGGRRIVSYDGTEWVDEHYDVVGGGDDDDLLRGVTYGGGLFVAVGGSRIGRFMWTADGAEWGADVDDEGWLGGVAYGSGTFVAAGGNGRRAVSEDGAEWETVVTDYGPHFRAIAFGGGVFVAVGDAGRRARSTDGKNWTNEVTGGTGLSSVAYGNGHFVAVGLGRRMWSADGTTWDEAAGGATDVVFADGEFLAVGGTTAYTSPDGAEWTTHTLNRPLEFVAYADGIYVGANWTPAGPVLLRSTDGLEWEEVASGGNGLTDLVGTSRR